MNILNFFSFLVMSVTAKVQCFDDYYQPTPYWVAFKYPESFKYSIYNSVTRTFNESEFDMSDTDRGALTNTMTQAWLPENNYIIYNDESPLPNSTYNFKYGHMKGVFIYDNDSAIWLQHSTPQFPLGPTFTGSYQGLTKNGYMYGQHFLCLEIDLESVSTFLEIVGLVDFCSWKEF